MDRIEKIQKLQKEKFKVEPKQSIVLGNFFAIITIVAICISVVYYVNYVVPAQEAKKQRASKIKKHQEYLEQRAKRIALSHKMNKKDTNATK